MMSKSIKACIIGSGPSGFFVAKQLLKKLSNVKICMLEKMPVPFGLIRYGVAPDNQEKKTSYISEFKDLLQSNASSLKWYGNIAAGEKISIKQLKKLFNVIVLCSGATAAKKLNIQGEDLKGVICARDFVNWYNGHPSSESQHEIIDSVIKRARDVAIFGHGNVSLDCARMLVKPTEELAKLDIPESRMNVLAQRKIQNVHIYGRRGAYQASFCCKELKKLGEMENTFTFVEQKDLDITNEFRALVKQVQGCMRKNMIANLQDLANRKPKKDQKRINLQFQFKPVEFLGDNNGFVKAVRIERTSLDHELKAKGTGQFFIIPCQMAIVSVGFKNMAIEGVPFDEERNYVPNINGRVQNDPQLYVSGWLKSGGKGDIEEQEDASIEVVDQIVRDVEQRRIPLHLDDEDGFDAFVAKKRLEPISWNEYLKIEKYEIEEGEKRGKLMEKIVSLSKMIEIAELPSKL